MSVAYSQEGQRVLTVAQAAAFLDRSTTWVRDQIVMSRLRTLHPYGVRPFLVTEASAQNLKARLSDRVTGAAKHRLQIITGGSAEAQGAPLPRHFPRLVIDNTRY